MHSQAMRNGDMYSITRAKFLGSAPFPEDCYLSWWCSIVTSMMKSWSPSSPSLYDCPASLFGGFPFGLSDDSPLANSHSSKYALFKVSPTWIHNTCSNTLCGALLPFWVSKSAGVAPLPLCSRKLLDESVKILAVFPRVSSFSIVKTIARCPSH